MDKILLDINQGKYIKNFFCCMEFWRKKFLPLSQNNNHYGTATQIPS